MTESMVSGVSVRQGGVSGVSLTSICEPDFPFALNPKLP